MNKLPFFCLLLLGCSLKNSGPALDCSGVNLKTVNLLHKEMVNIDVPMDWNNIDTMLFNPDKYIISSTTISSDDSVSYYFDKVFTLPAAEIQRTDSLGLISQLDGDLKWITRGRDSLLSSDFVEFQNWRIAAHKSYITSSGHQIVGQVVCAKDSLRIEIFVKIQSDSLQKAVTTVSCILNSLKISNTKILNVE